MRNFALPHFMTGNYYLDESLDAFLGMKPNDFPNAMALREWITYAAYAHCFLLYKL